MNKTLIFLFPVIIGLGSCKSALIKQYAVKEPGIETLESVRKSLNQYSPFYTGYLCVFRDSAALVNWFKNNHLPGRSLFYNSTGYRIITQDSAFCSGVEADFANNLKINIAYRIDSVNTFEKLKKNLLPVGEKVDLDPSKFAFTCVVFWADFMGKINQPGFQIAESAMKSQPAQTGRMNILFVDMDIMDFWNTSGSMIKTITNTR
ncbi:MAG: hypothetical protein D4R97_04700 [Bacteroidetes bacterium]|nr:MAG: hypothetical protein D4R97_04700 [Bacteroidota bacterium]